MGDYFCIKRENMLNTVIQLKTAEWIESEECSVKDLLGYIRKKGELRDTQIQALETYLFLKIKGENKALWQLFSEGFFDEDQTDKYFVRHPDAINFLDQNISAKAVFNFAAQPNGEKVLLPSLVDLILASPESIDYEEITKNIFYNVSYADYLMSLPMGAGKTFLMAAMIYLDLYFANNEPENKIFAHNFLVLIPSGLKSSIVPSLRTIENFDPSWVLPEPAASKIKGLLKFDILDQAKSANKSNKAKNPNAQKVNQCLPDPFGQVFVVNAEKVILNRTYLDDQKELFEKSDDEKDKYANELRNLIGKIPNLEILIDEVHHATDKDIKLRQVVNKWNETGNITTVLGFSGTPYLSKADKIYLNESSFFKFSQITNTVYYYPLVTAINHFLKTPKVRVAYNLDKFQVIEKGIRDFQEDYAEKIYENGNIAKIAIYCSNIKSLEEEIYPFLTGTLKINPDEILKYHRGNSAYKLPAKNELLFNTLDIPKTKAATKVRYILLVQIGKEGWDCRSLTGIILAQKGASPKNMVLQTSCRCLRQVDKGKYETARIWLNEYNAKILNNQLKKEQETSIEALNQLGRKVDVEKVERFSRIAHLQLPKVEFYQLEITYSSVDEEKNANTRAKLEKLFDEIEKYKESALIKSSEIHNLEDAEISMIEEIGEEFADFNRWLFEISKESFNQISLPELKKFRIELKKIFDAITFKREDALLHNKLYRGDQVKGQVRLAFSIQRQLQTKNEVVNQEANLLIVNRLKAVDENAKLFPNEQDVEKILELDTRNAPVEIDLEDIKRAYEFQKESIKGSVLESMFQPFETFKMQFEYSFAVKSKERTFHYLPYDFRQSGFEKAFLRDVLSLADFRKMDLEIYYNGERGLTEFVINCYAKANGYWKNIGKYTSDFLIIKRKDEAIYKALIVETKGAGFENDPVFQQKRKFVESDFLAQNKAKFGYDKFDFLYLVDSNKGTRNLSKLNLKINNFFRE